MKSRKITVFTALFVFIYLTNPASAYRDIVDLGTLGGTQSWGISLNESGQVVGYSYDSSGYLRACLFDSTGGGANIDLGTLGGHSSALGHINNQGQIVGIATNTSGWRACLFDSSGGGANIDLGNGYVWSINDNGIIVGASSTGHGCIFDPAGGGVTFEFDLGPACSINNNNQVVGKPGWLYDLGGDGEIINLGTLGGNHSEALYINNNGLIIGWSKDSFGNEAACLFDATGGGNNIDLGTLGGISSRAWGINDMGEIVGWAQDISGNQVACLFDSSEQGNNINLNTLISPSSRWTLTGAYSINNKGWITGQGINPLGYEHAFLIIPEPATILLLVSGAIATRRRR